MHLPNQQTPLPALVIGTWGTQKICVPDLPVRFPRLPSRSRADEETILNVIARDLLDAAGDASPWPHATVVG